MRHLTAETLLDFIERTRSLDENPDIAAHISTCNDCAELEQDLNRIVRRLRDDAAFEPPAELVNWAVNLLQPMFRPESRQLRKFIAALVFDTAEKALLPFGMRGMAAPRQLLFRAGEVDVDIRIESLEALDRITLAGQVLSSAPKFFDNAPVKLESQGTVRFITRTNAVGEFSFDEIPKDTYHLSVELPEGLITLFCLPRGNS